MELFDPLRYWEERHEQSVGLCGVGYLGLGSYNDWMYRVRRRVFRRVLRPYAERIRGARALDVGSGSGFYLEEWIRQPIGELVGSDFSSVAVRRLRQSFPSIRIEHLDIGTGDQDALAQLGRFDVISVIDVLFHIVDDALYDRAFRNLARLLKPEGALLFTENFLQSARRGGQAWHILRERGEVEAAVRQAGLRLEMRVPWFMLMNKPVDSMNRFLHGGWSVIERISRRSRIGGFVLGAAMYPAELLLTQAFTESPTSEIAIARHLERPGARARYNDR